MFILTTRTVKHLVAQLAGLDTPAVILTCITCAGDIMGLAGGDLLVPPVGTGGDTVTHLGTGAREA